MSRTDDGGMDQVIPIINKLQDVFSGVGDAPLELPMVVVLGSQSAGKSSVLEAIVGRDFLPRGTGIVTRRPLNLQLHNTLRFSPADSKVEGSDEWAEFNHLPGKIFLDFAQVRQEIIRITDAEAGRGKRISRTPITLKVFSPRVVDLQLVDLPGITKVPVGDQPADIEVQVRDMCLEYINNSSSIILAVSEATVDIANSEALKLARLVDPQGLRTLGVLTKLDLMDHGTDAGEVLLNRVIPLRHGFVGVVNRSQQDIVRNEPMSAALAKEQRFFQEHRVYGPIAARMGVAYLARRLNALLVDRVKEALPDIRTRIQTMQEELQREMALLGEPVGDQERARSHMLLTFLSQYSNNFEKTVSGAHATSAGGTEVRGGARIAYIFAKVFSKWIESFDACSGLDDLKIQATICNVSGASASWSVPETAFRLLVKQQIAKLEEPGLRCVELVFEELNRIALTSQPQEFGRFTNLQHSVLDTVGTLLQKSLAPTQMMVRNLIQIELSHLNVLHPDFAGARLRMTIEDDSPRHFAPAATGAAFPTDVASALMSGQPRVPQHFTDLSAEEADFEHAAVFRMPDVIHVDYAGASADSRAVALIICATFHWQPLLTPQIAEALLQSYMAIVKKTFADMVPKTIMCFLVNAFKERLYLDLIQALYRPDANYDQLFQESEEATQRRRECKETLGLLTKAMEIVHEVRSFSVD